MASYEEESKFKLLFDLIEKIVGVCNDNRAVLRGQPFMTLGLDSLQMMELRTQLQLALQVHLSPTALFDHPTPQQLISSIVQRKHPPASSIVPNLQLTHTTTIPLFAICGMGCRFPGNARSPEIFFNNLCEGMDSVQRIPAAWGWDCVSSHVGMLDDISAEGFDPVAFGLSASEAQTLDPHQRILLQVCMEALSCSGLLSNSASRPRRIGVFVGLCNNEWSRSDSSAVSPFTSTSTAQSAAANRLSFILGLTGPSMVVDSACSSSLTALHTALNAIRCGDCDAAVVAAADLLLSPHSLKVPSI